MEINLKLEWFKTYRILNKLLLKFFSKVFCSIINDEPTTIKRAFSPHQQEGYVYIYLNIHIYMGVPWGARQSTCLPGNYELVIK